jgi:hypothetical protein
MKANNLMLKGRYIKTIKKLRNIKGGKLNLMNIFNSRNG